jgi:magnesium-transporting ATPase (P-type)
VAGAAPDENRRPFCGRPAENLVLLGVIGLMDPPRLEAIEAVEECRIGGIRVTMITGDHKITAAAIAAMLGIGDGKAALAGRCRWSVPVR